MELRHIRYFVAVAEELNFTRASIRLRVAQPALSKQIRDLEREIEVKLLERSSHHVAMTAAGEIFLDRCRKILTESDDAVAAARRAHRGETGMLAVGFIGSISHAILPKVLQAYRQKYPEVELNLSELGPAEQVEAILKRTLDIGFLGMAQARKIPELRVETLAEERLMAAVPSGHTMAGRKEIQLKAFQKERFILTSRRNAPLFNEWLIGLCRKAGFVPEIIREVDRAPTVLNYIAAGEGVSVFPLEIAKSAAPGVAFIPLIRLPSYRYCMAWRNGETDGAVMRFVEISRHIAKVGRERGHDGSIL